MKKKMKKVLKNQRGQGMVEYVLIIVIVVGVLLSLRGRIQGWIENSSNKVSDQMESF